MKLFLLLFKNKLRLLIFTIYFIFCLLRDFQYKFTLLIKCHPSIFSGSLKFLALLSGYKSSYQTLKRKIQLIGTKSQISSIFTIKSWDKYFLTLK